MATTGLCPSDSVFPRDMSKSNAKTISPYRFEDNGNHTGVERTEYVVDEGQSGKRRMGDLTIGDGA